VNFCSACGHPVESRIPAGDSRERDVCGQCGAIHYVNPKLVLGTIPVWEGKVLLCKRAIEPRLGYWTLPAGYMETGETTAQGALRETLEESGANVSLGPLFTMIDVPHVEQIHAFFLADMVDPGFAAGAESLEVRMFSEEEIPWGDLAFPTISRTLKYFFADRAAGSFGLHVEAITFSPRRRQAADAD
jgi:ADP-ribose pyrophosphatase YjhB (NUDIX family)